MTAQEAERIAIERLPIYEKERCDEHLEHIRILIKKEVDKGHFDLYYDWQYIFDSRHHLVKKQLEDEGYYVSVRSTKIPEIQGNIVFIICWGKESKELYSTNDRELKEAQIARELRNSKNKFRQIYLKLRKWGVFK